MEKNTDSLFEELYQDLRKIAAVRMRGERAGHILQTTALLNETYLRLRSVRAARWESPRHFLAAAALMMRRILIDHARKQNRRVLLQTGLEGPMGVVADGTDFVHIDRAIEALAVEHSRQALAVQFRYILGMPVEEVARALEVTPRTINEDGRFALAWMRRFLSRSSAIESQ